MRTDVLFAWPNRGGRPSSRRRSDLPSHIFRALFERGRRRDLARGTLRRNSVVLSARTHGARERAA